MYVKCLCVKFSKDSPYMKLIARAVDVFKHFDRDVLGNCHSAHSIPPIGFMLHNAMSSLKR